MKSDKQRLKKAGKPKKFNISAKMRLYICIKGMQAKVSASIAIAEAVPGHVVRTVTQIAERTLREAFLSVPFVREYTAATREFVRWI